MSPERQKQSVAALERHIEDIKAILKAVNEGRMEISALTGNTTIGYEEFAPGHHQRNWLASNKLVTTMRLEVVREAKKPPPAPGDLS